MLDAGGLGVRKALFSDTPFPFRQFRDAKVSPKTSSCLAWKGKGSAYHRCIQRSRG